MATPLKSPSTPPTAAGSPPASPAPSRASSIKKGLGAMGSSISSLGSATYNRMPNTSYAIKWPLIKLNNTFWSIFNLLTVGWKRNLPPKGPYPVVIQTERAGALYGTKIVTYQGDMQNASQEPKIGDKVSIVSRERGWLPWSAPVEVVREGTIVELIKSK